MKRPTDKGLVSVAFWVAVGMLLASSLATHQSTTRLVASGGRIGHTRAVSENVQQIFIDLQEAEIGARGLLRTGNPNYRLARQTALTKVEDAPRKLNELATEDSAPRGELDALRGLVDSHCRLDEQALT